MRWIILASVALTIAGPSAAQERAWPLVERFLHSGELTKGEQSLESALASQPGDDQARFGLGVLRLVKGVERLGQSLYEYGAKSENVHAPFLRLPVPHNPDPAAIRYTVFRRILDDFYRDLASAEQALAVITDERVRLPIRLAEIRIDLTGSGKANHTLLSILHKLFRQQVFGFQKENPEFLVCFDRGDVAWLRAYCHLLMGMLDFYLALESEPWFDKWADSVFTKVAYSNADKEARQRRWNGATDRFVLKEPGRLGRFRNHMMRVVELNRETWKFIGQETDDDHEWLPNPRQRSVFGLPVRSEMIDSWLDALSELEALLDGKKTVHFLFLGQREFYLNFKAFLDNPPIEFSISDLLSGGLPIRYYDKLPEVDMGKFHRVLQVFDTSVLMPYMAWFN